MQLIIDSSTANQRFDRFLRKWCKTYPEVKLSDIYSRIRKGDIKVNGKKGHQDDRLQVDDEILIPDELLGKKDTSTHLTGKERKIKKLSKEDIQPLLLFEDTNRVAFNKPAGVVAHESNNHWNDLSMNDYLEIYAKDYEQGTFKPSFGYRLDKDTSGVLIGAKNYEALQFLNQIIREREIDKTYITLVSGNPPQHFIVDKAIEKSYSGKFDRAQMIINPKGMASKTECRTLKTIFHAELGQISLMKVKLYTGRMHQIRIHLASEGYPVLGDLVYGIPVVNRKFNSLFHINRQLLHCWNYRFVDHTGKVIDITASIPDEFERVIPNIEVS
jgi:23S rRNA pseudouridine955/2504/2580 synthase